MRKQDKNYRTIGQEIIMQYAQYLVVFVCLSVCLPTLIPALQATRCNMSGSY